MKKNIAEYNLNNMPTGIRRNNHYLIKILEIAENSIDTGSFYDVEDMELDRTVFVWHVRWLMVRGYIRECSVEVTYTEAELFEHLYSRSYVVTPITTEGLKFLADLKKSHFRKFLEGSPDSTAYLLMKRSAEIIGYITVISAILKLPQCLHFLWS